MAALKVREKLARIAAARLNVRPDELEFGGGRIFARENPDNAVSFHRIAGEAHWSPGTLPPDLTPGLRETVQWSPPQLTATTEDNQINSMAVYGFGFDYCGVEIDPDTGEIRLDKYVTIHDCGPLLNPGIAEGQIGGSFAYGLNTALYEEFVYGEDGSFLSGTYADYIVGTAHEIPRFVSLQPSRRNAFAMDGVRRKGHIRRQRHQHPRLRRQCGRRCAGAQRHQAAAAAFPCCGVDSRGRAATTQTACRAPRRVGWR